MNLRDLTLRARALFAPKRAERDLRDELQFHIEREARKLMDDGMTADEARMKAHARFGSITVAADQCRDERGTAFIDNTVGDIQFALRTFRRSPLTSFTIVATVAIGLGIVAMLFTVLNVLVFRTDSVPDINEMYAVERPEQANDDASPFTRTRFEALREETNVFAGAYAAVNELDLRVDGRMMAVNLVSGGFFHAVAVNPVIGRALSPDDDDRAGGNPVLVLSDRGWQRHFNRDPNVLGKTVLVTGAPFEIIGVMPEGFRGLQVSAPDFWAPLARIVDFLPNVRGSEDKAGVQIIGRLKPGISMESARAQLAAWDANQSAGTTERTMSIELVPQRGTVPQPLEAIAAVHAVVLRVRADPADWLRQCRQPVARPRGRTPARDRHSALDRRIAEPHCPAVADRERVARARGSRRRVCRRRALLSKARSPGRCAPCPLTSATSTSACRPLIGALRCSWWLRPSPPPPSSR